jgi:hypothetical protein
VTDGILDFDFIQNGAVVELNQQSVSDRTLVGCVVLLAEPFVFDAESLGTQRIDARISRSLVSAGKRRL